MVAADPGHPTAPLDAERLRAALRGEHGAAGGTGTLWTDVRIVAATASTNTDVLRLAAAGSPEGLVIAAESQTAGKGRQGRIWQTRPGAALTFSLLVRPDPVPQAGRGWLPLLAGVAVVHALGQVSGLDARLKWPNDVLAGDMKLAGILAEQAGRSCRRRDRHQRPWRRSGPAGRYRYLAGALRRGRNRPHQPARGDPGASSSAGICAGVRPVGETPRPPGCARSTSRCQRLSGSRSGLSSQVTAC